MKKSITILCMILLTLVLASNGYAGVAEGRAFLFNNGSPSYPGLLAANDEFKTVLLGDPNHEEANFFYAITRLAALLDPDLPSTPGVPIESVDELLESFGVSGSGRDIFNWTADFSKDLHGDIILPANVPYGGAVQEFWQAVFIPEIDNALANLSVISSSFTLTLLTSETGDDYDIEVDCGDVLIYKSFLYAAKSAMLILSAYDLNVDPKDIIAKVNQDIFKINTDLLERYSELFELLTGGGITMSDAKTAALDAIDSYLSASSFIRGEQDDQTDDLISFYPEDLDAEAEFRNNLAEVKTSLIQERIAFIETKDGTRVDHVDFNHLFGTPTIDPLNVRAMLPAFDRFNNIHAGTLPDTTLAGILVDCTTEAKLVEMYPGPCPIVFPISERTISIDGNSNDWQNIISMSPVYFSSYRSWWYNSGDIEHLKFARDDHYLYWMIQFQNPPQATSYYVGFFGPFETGWASVYVNLQPGQYYQIQKWPSDTEYSGTASDYHIGNIVEGRIPIEYFELEGILGSNAGAYNSQSGYSANVYDGSILTTETPSIANAGPDQLVYDSVTLDGHSIYPDVAVVSWEWSLSNRSNPALNQTATGPNPTVNGLQTGLYDVTLTVEDAAGRVGSDTMILGVGDTGGLYTQEQLDQAILDEIQKWDVGSDGKITLEEAIRALQVVSGMRAE